MTTRPTTRYALALTLVALSACGQGRDGTGGSREGAPGPGSGDTPAAPTDTTAGPGPSASPHAWLQSGFVSPGATASELRDRFGPPDERTVSPTPNRHVPDQTDTLVTLTYDRGLTIELYSVTGGDDLLQSVVVSSPGVVSYDEPVDVGSTWETVTSILGPPSGRRDGMPFYACEGCPAAESPVFFDVVDGVVRRIRFTYYVD